MSITKSDHDEQPVSEDIILFTGTSSTRLSSILSDGLKPQTNPDSLNRGNASTIDGWTDDHVYLTDSHEAASVYAAREADHSGGDPVVLRVRIENTVLLRPDDDHVINSVVEVLARQNGWTGPGDGSAEEACDNYSGILQAVQIALCGDLSRIAEACYCDEEYARMLRDAVVAAMASPWEKSLHRTGNVAYAGTIGPAFIEQVQMQFTTPAPGSR